MGSTKFWGKDPKTFCPKGEKALELFKKEKTTDFSPHWGGNQTQILWEKNCKE